MSASTPRDIADFIESLDHSRREDVAALHAAIRDAAPELPVKLWEQKLWGGTEQSIIGYGEATSPRSSGKSVTWYLVGLALQKDYISLYINAAENGEYLAESRAADLGKVKVGKSVVSFKNRDDLNLDVALDLVRRAALQADST